MGCWRWSPGQQRSRQIPYPWCYSSPSFGFWQYFGLTWQGSGDPMGYPGWNSAPHLLSVQEQSFSSRSSLSLGPVTASQLRLWKFTPLQHQVEDPGVWSLHTLMLWWPGRWHLQRAGKRSGKWGECQNRDRLVWGFPRAEPEQLGQSLPPRPPSLQYSSPDTRGTQAAP